MARKGNIKAQRARYQVKYRDKLLASAAARRLARGQKPGAVGRPSKADALRRDPAAIKRSRKAARFRKYGIAPADFQAMLEAQFNLCAICGSPLPLTERGHGGDERDARYIDHCHLTGKVRGIVHRDCNLIIGIARDSVLLLQKARDYLIRHGAVEPESREPISVAIDEPQLGLFDRTLN